MQKDLAAEDLQLGMMIEPDTDLTVQFQHSNSEMEGDPNLPCDSDDPQPGTSGITTAAHFDCVAARQPSSDSELVAAKQKHISTKQIKRKGIGKGKGRGKGKGKGKGKSRGKVTQTSYEDSDKCAVCNISYIEGEDWICCDLCSLWYHRECVNLQEEQQWLKYSEEEEPFTCPMCL